MKSKLKKFIVLCLSCLLIFALCSCGQLVGPDPSDTSDSGITSDSSGSNSSGDDLNEDADAFTVTVRTATSIGLPAGARNLQARWTNMESSNSAFYTASFSSDGVARIKGLDGDYRVTLINVPDGYTYDPNIYTADNDHRNVEILLHQITATTGSGAGWYESDIITLKTMGVYRATLTRANYVDGVHFKIAPTVPGLYSIESIIDITANELNPWLDVYVGNSAWVASTPTAVTDGGGSENTYTKNFRWEMQLKNVGPVFYFCVRGETLTPDIFPITVDFILDRDGEITNPGTSEAVVVTPTHDFDAAEADAFDDASGRFTYFAYYNGANGVLDGKRVQLADDGYYHIYDPETRAYGKKLYAKISQDNLVLQTDGGNGFMYGMVRLTNVNGYNYNDFIRSGYGLYTNGDGVYPVTEELKQFLQNYSIAQRFFNDGNGLGETNGLSSSEKDQWLFACGYYA